MKVFISKRKLVNEFAKELAYLQIRADWCIMHREPRTNTVRICQVKCLTMWQNFVAYVLI